MLDKLAGGSTSGENRYIHIFLFIWPTVPDQYLAMLPASSEEVFKSEYNTRVALDKISRVCCSLFAKPEAALRELASRIGC